MNENTPYQLFANCIPVRGAGRSTICDLQRNRIHLIPGSLFELLEATQGQTIAGIKKAYHHEYNDILEEYFHFLEAEELIFFTNTPDLFPPITLQWHHPATLIYAILDICKSADYDVRKVIEELDCFDCKYLELRSYDILSLEHYEGIVKATEETTIISVGLIVPFDQRLSEQDWIMFCDRNKRITSIVIHGSPFEADIFSNEFAVPVSYIQDMVANEKCCGVIKAHHFTSYLETYTESLTHNSCLNRKIGIDVEGNIKNCPSMKESFGNIRDTTLAEAIAKPGFTRYWNLTKDVIKVCRDCEFRHVCTDCRAYLEQPEDAYSKPLKCGYNPYTCTWEEWSTHPMKQGAIDHYGMQDLVRSLS